MVLKTLKEIRFKQVQKATSLPIENTEKVSVTLWDDGEQEDIVFVGLPDYWIRIDLTDKTFSVGDYEG